MKFTARAADCPCVTHPRKVHADHLQPGDEVWLPNGRWVRYEWTDASEGTSAEVVFCPDGGDKITVTADRLLKRR